MNADVPRRAAGKKPRWTTAQKLARDTAKRRAARANPGSRERGVPSWESRGGRSPGATRYDRDGRERFGDRRARPGGADRPGGWERRDRSQGEDPRASPEWGTAGDRGVRGPSGGRPDRPSRFDRPMPRRTGSQGRAQGDRGTGSERREDRGGRGFGGDRRPGVDAARRRQAGTDRDDRGRREWEPRLPPERPRGGGSWEPRGPRRHEGRRPDHHTKALIRQERPPRSDRAERTGAEAKPVTVGLDNAFLTAGVPMSLVRRLAAQGIASPFPIQQATLPDALAGRDILGRGQTGSGKTLAFGLPLITRLMGGPKAAPNRPLGIVLVPTRELAIQVTRALEPLAATVGLRFQLVAGGLSYAPQLAALARGVEILVATPGRLVDLMDKHAADLSGVRIAVLDEADHMAEMGFVPEVTAILDAIPAGGQRLLFSATLDRGVDQIVATYLNDPVTHSTDDVTAAVTTMEHHILLVEPPHKKLVTAEVANRGGRTLVFARTKLGAERVAEQLREQGVFAAALHGGLNQRVRGRILAAFQEGVLPVLVATDVAARGIHVEGIELVLQIDPPADHKDYLHRAGRTARAGDRGIVVTLALPHQHKPMQRLAREAGVKVAAVAAGPGDPVLTDRTGARRPHRPPVPAEQLRRVVEGDSARRSHGVRAGGRRPSTRGRTPRG